MEDTNSDDTHWKSLKKDLQSHTEYFNQMLELIPSRNYFVKDEEPVIPYHQGKKVKKAKSEYDWGKSIPEIMAQKAAEMREGDEENDNEDDKKVEVVTGFSGLVEREELLKRYHEKLESLKTKRKLDDASKLEPPAKRRKTEKQERPERTLKVQKSQKKSKLDDSDQTSKDDVVDDKNLEFATFDFSSGQPVPTYLKEKKPKNKQSLLRKLEQKKAKQQELLQSEGGEKVVTEQTWDAMLKKAAGEKVKDDITKLKKSIKRDQQKKKKSEKEWYTVTVTTIISGCCYCCFHPIDLI
eukprot:TRINITY_DN1978_c0_g1_i1.p1 TRINITY_DN1978_c0_g1~~TRINITY_DN1978_c0_g1_i1.p1  ORF type:complete len:296 (-),score=93.79 TRINITY_DN1978_c0_g1_i1:251-1138(-)